ncbi:excalibur calcium-binding domain-containing protein [Sphingomonas sp. CFBP 13720]|uniref:excalibur calcium-binding domain-containing protein n=1 Tax=Sphingomonas sp. CFBP 13720 TaxID=2775302 RepID=UPI00201703CB|nr:excalibur calcium-binding domain-containing protein [Sphingomonas sp. CFBP 13720]
MFDAIASHADVRWRYLRKLRGSASGWATPVRAGDPGYSSKLDRDGDGVGCGSPLLRRKKSA